MRRRAPKTSEPMASLQPTSTPTCKGQEHKVPASYYHSGPLVASLSASSLAADSDQESMMFCSTTLSDVSNYLPSPVHSSEDMSCPTTLDSESFRYASPTLDMYGWDAELDRRNFTPSRSSMGSSEGCDDIPLSYRRANGSKASLLQRVFRVGSSSSMGKYETAV
ncbi:RGS domain-containing protein [Fusarium sp. LHS14.1]|nr:RGS domain-containing protein [Fusarium sp. LHS14.1]